METDRAVITLSVLLSGTNVALMGKIDDTLRLYIDVALAILFTLIILYVYFQNKRNVKNKAD